MPPSHITSIDFPIKLSEFEYIFDGITNSTSKSSVENILANFSLLEINCPLLILTLYSLPLYFAFKIVSDKSCFAFSKIILDLLKSDLFFDKRINSLSYLFCDITFVDSIDLYLFICLFLISNCEASSCVSKFSFFISSKKRV